MVEGVGIRVQGLGFRVWDLGFRALSGSSQVPRKVGQPFSKGPPKGPEFRELRGLGFRELVRALNV